MKPATISLLVTMSITAIAVTGCSCSDDEGLPVRVVNESAWDARVLDIAEAVKS
ncbi:hypothetical protein [Streptomyces sp. NPDC091209]|uniref:hypothetical protein n=1 Tax=Streptomyces sp. NPDC091209 TaxID=3365974 RepID=UPI0037F44037